MLNPLQQGKFHDSAIEVLVLSALLCFCLNSRSQEVHQMKHNSPFCSKFAFEFLSYANSCCRTRAAGADGDSERASLKNRRYNEGSQFRFGSHVAPQPEFFRILGDSAVQSEIA